MPVYRMRVEQGVVRVYLERADPAMVAFQTSEGNVFVEALVLSGPRQG